MIFKKSQEKLNELKEMMEALAALCRETRKEQDILIESLDKRGTRIEKELDKNNMSVEDVLVAVGEVSDTLAGQEEERNLFKDKLRECGNIEERLLELVMLYQDMFADLWRYAGKNDEALIEQLELAGKRIQKCSEKCEICGIGDTGVPVDLSRYEVVGIEETSKRELDGMVAIVYSVGCLYKGSVVKKAKAAVYKYNSERGVSENEE